MTMTTTITTATIATTRTKRAAPRISYAKRAVPFSVPPEDPELRRFRTDAIRELKPYFPVYSIDANSQYYDASGKHRGMISDIKTFAEGNRLTDLLAETPDYIPGRIITFKTTKMETLSKRFVEGKNIEQPLKQLRTAANGSGEKAEEAQRMLAAVEAHLDAMVADIDADLKAAPSRALSRIEVLMKTSPSMGARYAGARQALRNNPAVRQLASQGQPRRCRPRRHRPPGRCLCQGPHRHVQERQRLHRR